VTCIANQGKTIGDKSPDNLHNKDAARYDAGKNQPLPLMRPVFMFMAMLILKVIIIYAMNVFDGISPG